MLMLCCMITAVQLQQPQFSMPTENIICQVLNYYNSLSISCFTACYSRISKPSSYPLHFCPLDQCFRHPHHPLPPPPSPSHQQQPKQLLGLKALMLISYSATFLELHSNSWFIWSISAGIGETPAMELNSSSALRHPMIPSAQINRTDKSKADKTSEIYRHPDNML